MATNEHASLLGGKDKSSQYERFTRPNRVLLAGFLISIALSSTQVPAPPGAGDRCSRNEIDASTAQAISILGLITLTCGIVNLFIAGWQTKTWGPKLALVCQTACPALRVAVQVLAVHTGAGRGVLLLQCSQFVGLVGGNSGYLLVLNTAAGEVVPARERTGMFGKLQGAVMLGTATGFSIGGLVGGVYGIRKPFEMAVALFLLSSLYAALFIPYIDPASLADAGSGEKGTESVFSPLKVLLPRKLTAPSGRSIVHYGASFLALGVFTGVLATGYAPALIQMYATTAFEFEPTQLGYLMASNSLIRGFFLMFAFPRIIAAGRRWFAASGTPRRSPGQMATTYTEQAVMIPNEPTALETDTLLGGQEPALAPMPVSEDAGRDFDLFFLRWSLVADGMITAFTASATSGWHIYVAGCLLPLASGSAPASKGVIVEMSPASKRADALQAMTLLENIAMLSTVGLFGFVFAAFSTLGKAHLTFYCNALVALLAAAILLFSSFPVEDGYDDGMHRARPGGGHPV